MVALWIQQRVSYTEHPLLITTVFFYAKAGKTSPSQVPKPILRPSFWQ
jgi:hypothetical protein